MRDEAVVAVAPQFNLDGVSRTVGDLVFTNRQILFAKTASGTDITGALFGVIGSAVAGAQSRKMSAALRDQPVEALLALSDDSGRFQYSSLERIEVRRRRLLSSLVIVRPRDGKRRKFWGKRSNLAQLIAAAQQLAAAGAPITVV